ncbi:sterol O-acyltransferase 2 isoform X2 [Rhineura floridana]|uniref:sterol O-acyltransferase 2 isoform X2 n=1 Tax=Rhineura floridana TaxID=261503 RepID=UPI002AC86886|nr:sterol O-acyltransferase 2 isoform X2 [Rhineura floridana]XP_061471131.1 sterol O-acyltransferase 2 isoform X2 [Rhineura floridana]
MTLPCWETSGEAKHLDSTAALIQWKITMEKVKLKMLKQVHTQLSELLDKALEEATSSIPQHLRKGLTEKESRKKGPLQEKQKVFVDRKSLLDELLEIEHFHTIYHMFVAMLCVFVLSTVIVDFIDEGRLVLDFKLFIFALGQLPVALFAWLCMFLYTLLVPYKVLQMWACYLRTVRFPNVFTVAVAVVLLVCHAAALGFYPVYTIVSYRLGPASRLIVILEQIRFLMKSHAFLRESVPPILHARSQDGKGHVPKFSTYLYFLFCPTLIYRESYPRTPYVRWRYVIKNFAEFLGCVFYMYFIFERLCIPVFTNTSKQPFRTLVLSIFNATLPGILLLLLSFFAFQHCWLNAFAEILRFADRTFYKDWWNSTSFSTYYRTWNVVVHDWLYYYVYQDLLWLLRGKARAVAMLTTFIVSAVVHEYAITFCLGFFYPVMFTLFAVFGACVEILTPSSADRHAFLSQGFPDQFQPPTAQRSLVENLIGSPIPWRTFKPVQDSSWLAFNLKKASSEAELPQRQPPASTPSGKSLFSYLFNILV